MFPLDGVRENDPENGGYEYLQFSDYQRGYHEGVDFNAGAGAWGDEGLNLLAIGPQALRWSGSSPTGFGNHQWWELTAGPYTGAFVHYAHAQGFTFEDEGHEVARGDAIGRCGHTGTTLPHLHCVVTRSRPPSWSWYGAPGVPREAVAAATHDPIAVAEAYNEWAAQGEPAHTVEADVTPELQAIADALTTSGYPASEVPALIAACAVWSANAGSLAEWIEKIGALEARVRELEAQVPSDAASA